MLGTTPLTSSLKDCFTVDHKLVALPLLRYLTDQTEEVESTGDAGVRPTLSSPPASMDSMPDESDQLRTYQTWVEQGFGKPITGNKKVSWRGDVSVLLSIFA